MLLFMGLGPDALALQAGEIIHEEFTIQMIYFVLNANGEKVIGFLFERLSIFIKGSDPDPFSALDVFTNIGNGQAALFHLDDPVLRGDRGVNQAQGLICLPGYIDDDYSFWNTDLGSCKTDTLGGIHGMEHIVDKPPGFIIDDLDRIRTVP